MPRLDIERQKQIEPIRMEIAIRSISKAGYEVTQVSSNKLKFEFKGKIVEFFPYSGWHTGKSIKDGRGLQKLLNQIIDHEH